MARASQLAFAFTAAIATTSLVSAVAFGVKADASRTRDAAGSQFVPVTTSLSRSSLHAGSIPQFEDESLSTGAGDPEKSVEISEVQAVTAVNEFVGGLRSGSLRVTGISDGEYQRTYHVVGDRLAADIDVHTGAVVTLYLGTALGVGDSVTIDQKEAIAVADSFVSSHSISVAGLSESASLVYHGEMSEYLVEWTNQDGALVVPDSRLVGVDASSGNVFRYANIHRAYDPAVAPKISKDGAIAIATQTLGRSSAQIEKVQLRIAFDDVGKQLLYWDIFLTELTDVSADGLKIAAHWIVQVDAMSGQSFIAASS